MSTDSAHGDIAVPCVDLDSFVATDPVSLIEWLWSKQYRLWWHVPPLFNPDNFFGDEVDLYPRVASINMVCLPRELELPIAGLEEVLTARHPLEGRL